jgi:hypothetical protein
MAQLNIRDVGAPAAIAKQRVTPAAVALGRVLIILRRCPVRPDTDRLCATAANVAMGQKATLC